MKIQYSIMILKDMLEEVDKLKYRGIEFAMKLLYITKGSMVVFKDINRVNIVLIQHDN